MTTKLKRREPSTKYIKYRKSDDYVWPLEKQKLWDKESQENVKSLVRKYSTPYQLQKMREKGLIGA